jgi:DNA-directed RNA polymerase specialized sigma subunit
MNIMDELRSIRALQKSINLDIEKDRLYAAQIGISTSCMRETGSRAHKEQDILGQQVSKMLDSRVELNARIMACEARKQAVEFKMLQLTPKQYNLMRLRYFDGKKWPDVAREVGYEVRECFYIHTEAIEVLERGIIE